MSQEGRAAPTQRAASSEGVIPSLELYQPDGSREHSGATTPRLRVLDSSGHHGGDSVASEEPGPSNPDSDPGQWPEEGPEDSYPWDAEMLDLGFPDLQTNQAPDRPGLQTLLQQLPPQDSGERYCLALGEEELPELRLFCAQRRQEALGQGVAGLVPPKLQGHTCEKCGELLKPGEHGVFAAPAGEQRSWHPACFTCQACGQALVDLIYFHHDGHLYCGRHHAELLRPRCPACDQLIFSRRCTEAAGRRWHENHFCCQDCAGPLRGGRYALPGGGPCCPSCFESRYSDTGTGSAATLAFGRTPLVQPGEGAGRLRGNQSGDRSRTAFPASSSPKTQGRLPACGPGREAPKGPEQGSLDPLDPKEDDPCPTCSSSSDSEAEGFFLGQPLPQPWETPGDVQAGNAASRKHCTIC